jgi:hypothetical protein
LIANCQPHREPKRSFETSFFYWFQNDWTTMKTLPVGDTEVLIIGAGPTGLVLALRLTRLGADKRIIDRTAGPRSAEATSLPQE